MSNGNQENNAEKTQKQDTSTESAAEEWTDIGRRIERQIRLDLAKWAGADETDSWEVIGRKAEAKIRSSMAAGLGAAPDASWEEIGRTVELSLIHISEPTRPY